MASYEYLCMKNSNNNNEEHDSSMRKQGQLKNKTKFNVQNKRNDVMPFSMTSEVALGRATRDIIIHISKETW